MANLKLLAGVKTKPIVNTPDKDNFTLKLLRKNDVEEEKPKQKKPAINIPTDKNPTLSLLSKPDGESLIDKSNRLKNKIKEATGQASIERGLGEFFTSLPGKVASLTQATLEEARKSHLPGATNIVTDKLYQAIAPQPKKEPLKISKALGDFAKRNQEFVEKTFPPEKTKTKQFIRDLASGAGSLASAMGVSLLTKSPNAAAAMFGGIQTGSIYQEALAKGKTHDEAIRIAVPAGVAEGMLEKIGLDFMLKKYGSKVAGFVVRTASEALQEGSQQLSEETITRIGGLREYEGIRPILDKVVYSAVLGGILGGGASIVLQSQDQAQTALEEKGLSKEEAQSLIENVFKKAEEQSKPIVKEIEKDIQQPEKNLPIDQSQFMKVESDILKETNIPEQDIVKYVRSSLADGAKLNTYTQEVMRGEMSKEEAIKKVQADYKKLVPEPIESAKQELPLLRKTKTQQAIEEQTGVKRLYETVSRREDVLLRERLRAEARGAKAGFAAGKELIREQESVKRDIQSTIDSLNRLGKRNIDADYKDMVDQELASLGIGKTLKAKRRLFDFIQEQKEQGELIPLSEEEIALSDYTTLGNISLELLKKKHDIIKKLVHIGSNANKMLATSRAVAIDKTVNKIADTIYSQRRITPKPVQEGYIPPSARKKGAIETAVNTVDSMFSNLRKTEFISRSLDGRQEGPTQENVIEPIQQAANKEMADTERDLRRFQSEMNKYSDKEIQDIFNKPLNVEGLDYPMTKAEIIGVYVNSLNQGNLQRLEAMGFDQNKITNALTNLTRKDINLANTMLEIVDGKWQESSDVLMKLTGQRMGRVQGRYWPIVTDKEIDTMGKLREAEKDLFQTVINRTFVEKGHTKSRVGGKAPVELNAFKVFLDHINRVNHFNSHALAVRDVQKVINNPKFKKAVIDAMGENIYNQYQPWLRNIANPYTPTEDATERWIGRLRRNATGATLGLKFTVSLVQAGSFTQTIHELGLKDSMRGLYDFYKNPMQAYDFVQEKSIQQRNREKTFDREIREKLESRPMQEIIKGDLGKLEFIYSMIKTIDKFTTYPSWLGAYNKALRKGSTEEKAISYADGVIRRTQPAGSVKDLAAISRGSQWKKLFTMFYTHFSNYHNQMALQYDYLKHGKDPALKRIGNSAVAWWWLMVAPAMFATYMKSGGRERDPKKYGKDIVAYGFSGLPLIRDVANAVVNRRFTEITSPALTSLEYAGKAGIEATRPMQGKETRPKKLAEYSTKTLGYLTGLPTQQGWVTMNGIIDLMDGNTKDLRRLIYSPYQLGETSRKKKGGLRLLK